MKKIWSFRLIAISIPFVFFLLLELALRLFGYGHQYSLFIENPDAPEYLLPRPDVVKRYFPKNSTAPTVTIETNFFKKEKPENGIRIFVQGGSTAAGFPYGFGASIAGMLDYRLKKSFPDRPVEVINTALAAVNSYTMLDFSDEIIEQSPDAILIYAGHNEFLGILGVGSAYTAANSQAATLMFLKFKELRVFQLLQNIYWSFSTDNAAATLSQQKSRTFMAKVAKHKNISTNSEIYQQGLEQFRFNISALIKKYNDAGIPVFISTIASNLKDQKPFVSSKIDATDLISISATLSRLQQHLSNLASIALPLKALNSVITVADKYQSADLYYLLAKYFQAHSELNKANDFYISARDHDQLRFRAPSEINDIIRELAAIHKIQLVDANAALIKHSQNGIIGNDLILEHLHPNLKGYFIIADSFYHALDKSGIFGKFGRVITSQSAAQEIPVFPAEDYWGRAKIAELMADYPFTETPQKPDFPPIKNWHDQMGFAAYKKKSSWLDIAIQTLKRSNNDPIHLTMAAKLLADALPHQANYSFQAGVLLIRNNMAAEAPRYLLRAIEIEPNNINAQLALSHAYIKQKRYNKALPWLNSVLKIAPMNKTALDAKKSLLKYTR